MTDVIVERMARPSDLDGVLEIEQASFNNPTTREWYERGCAEASQLMRSLLTEIEEHGVPQPMGPLPSSAPEPEEMEGDFPTVDLPGGAPAPPPQAAEPPPPPPARVERRKHPRQESPKLEETLREVTGGEAAPRRPTPKPAPKERGSVSRRVRERLKDMLGLGEMSPARAPEPEPEPESELQPDPMDHEFEPRVELPEPPLPPPAVCASYEASPSGRAATELRWFRICRSEQARQPGTPDRRRRSGPPGFAALPSAACRP